MSLGLLEHAWQLGHASIFFGNLEMLSYTCHAHFRK